jgi:hypothetical protein
MASVQSFPLRRNTCQMRCHVCAGLAEDAGLDDSELAEVEAAAEREAKVTAYIANTFKRLTIATAENGVTYAEYPKKSAMVVLDDEPLGFSIEKLYRLYETGMSERYNVVPNDRHSIRIEFDLSEMVYHVLGLV